MSLVLLFDLLVLVVLLLIAARLVPATWQMWRLYSGISARRLEDASGWAPPAPPAVRAVADDLEALGFSRLGERSAVLPGNQRRFEWNLADQASTTYVALVPAALPGGLLMACYSCFADGAFVVTSYPRGTRVVRADFDSAGVGGTPQECVSAHRQRVAVFSASHGQPLENHSMADLLDRDATYRSHHAGATMRGRVYGFVAVAAFVVVTAGLDLFKLLFIDR